MWSCLAVGALGILIVALVFWLGMEAFARMGGDL